MDDGKKFSNSEFKFKDLDKEAWSLWENSNVVDFPTEKLPFHLETDEHDMVNSPAHYTKGKCGEAIDIIEDAIEEAPSTKTGVLQAQVLKYMLRLWHKIDAKEDAEKARWYLNRLIDSLS